VSTFSDKIIAGLRAPLRLTTSDEVSRRLDEFFKGRWSVDYGIRRLGTARSLPEGSTSLQEIPFCLVHCTVRINEADGSIKEFSSSVLGPQFGDWTEGRLKLHAFLNTTLREMCIGLGRLCTQEVTFGLDTGDSGELIPQDLGNMILDGKTRRVYQTRQPQEDYEEKRKSPRKLLPLIRSIPLTIEINGGKEDLSIFLLDISRSGMRIISDFDFTLNSTIPLRLSVENLLVEMEATISWKKTLWYGMYFVGFQFRRIITEDFDRMCRFLEGLSADDRREHFRLERDLLLELQDESREVKCYSITCDLSASGVKTAYRGAPFKPDSEVYCTIFTGFEEDQFEVRARTVWSREPQKNLSVSAFKFIHLDEETNKRIQKLIELCIISDLREALDEIPLPSEQDMPSA
jgi:hypothetical protein